MLHHLVIAHQILGLPLLLVLALWAEQGCSRKVEEVARAESRPAPSTSPSSNRYSVRVLAVHEGDMIEVAKDGKNDRVRLYGIDAPEEGQPHGVESRKACTTMCSGKEVVVEVKRREGDDQVVGIVALPGDKSLNRALVWCGDAWWDRKSAPDDGILAACEADARKAQRGLWASPNPIAPWEWQPTVAAKSAPQPSPSPTAPAPPSTLRRTYTPPPPARRPSPTPPPQLSRPEPAASTGRANFSGNWNCQWGRDSIPGALTQSGSNLQGYCVYPNGKRATFQGTVSGNTLSGTLHVDVRTQWVIQATLHGDSLNGTWGRGSGGSAWSAVRR